MAADIKTKKYFLLSSIAQELLNKRKISKHKEKAGTEQICDEELKNTLGGMINEY